MVPDYGKMKGFILHLQPFFSFYSSYASTFTPQVLFPAVLVPLFPSSVLLHPPRVTSRLTCGWVQDLGLAVAAGNSQTLGDGRLHK